MTATLILLCGSCGGNATPPTEDDTDAGSTPNGTIQPTAGDLQLAEALGVDAAALDAAQVATTARCLESVMTCDSHFQALIASVGAAGAKPQMVAALSADADIEWTAETAQGVNVQYRSGLGCTLLLDPRDGGPPDAAAPPKFAANASLLGPGPTARTLVNAKKTLYI